MLEPARQLFVFPGRHGIEQIGQGSALFKTPVGSLLGVLSCEVRCDLFRWCNGVPSTHDLAVCGALHPCVYASIGLIIMARLQRTARAVFHNARFTSFSAGQVTVWARYPISSSRGWQAAKIWSPSCRLDSYYLSLVPIISSGPHMSFYFTYLLYSIPTCLCGVASVHG